MEIFLVSMLLFSFFAVFFIMTHVIVRQHSVELYIGTGCVASIIAVILIALARAISDDPSVVNIVLGIATLLMCCIIYVVKTEVDNGYDMDESMFDI